VLKQCPAVTVLVLVLQAAAIAEAGTIALTTDVAATVTASGLLVSLKITNSGDEAARSLVPSVTLPGNPPSRVQEATNLGAGQSLEARLEVPWAGKRSGQWPITTVVDYADANGYPLQAVQVALLTLGAPTPSLMALVDVDAPSFATSGNIKVHLKSLSPAALRVELRAVGPRGLEVAGALAPLAFEPWADQESSISVTNRGVLPGSRVPVFVVAEYEDEDGHHASVTHRLIEIKHPAAAVAVTAPYYAFVVAVVLVAVWSGVYVWRRRGAAKR